MNTNIYKIKNGSSDFEKVNSSQYLKQEFFGNQTILLDKASKQRKAVEQYEKAINSIAKSLETPSTDDLKKRYPEMKLLARTWLEAPNTSSDFTGLSKLEISYILITLGTGLNILENEIYKGKSDIILTKDQAIALVAYLVEFCDMREKPYPCIRYWFWAIV